MGPRINGSTWIVETGGRRFNSLHPQSSYSYLSSGSLISLKPPAAPPSSLFYLRLVAFCYFSSSLTRFHPLLIRFSVGRIVHFVKMSLKAVFSHWCDSTSYSVTVRIPHSCVFGCQPLVLALFVCLWAGKGFVNLHLVRMQLFEKKRKPKLI
jgi:hypothetical protein